MKIVDPDGDSIVTQWALHNLTVVFRITIESCRYLIYRRIMYQLEYKQHYMILIDFIFIIFLFIIYVFYSYYIHHLLF